MKVMIKFSDLRKLEDKTKEMENLYNETIRLGNALDKAVERERKLYLKLESTKNTTEEIKLLTDENNVLIEENNRLKTYAERKQPKFWFWDKVRIKEDTAEEFIIGRMIFKNGIFLFSDTFGDYTLYEEHELELFTDEHISK